MAAGVFISIGVIGINILVTYMIRNYFRTTGGEE